MKLKLLATNDVHQMSSKWKALVKEAILEKPDVVAIAGDIFPKDNGIPYQMYFVKHLKKYAEQIKLAGIDLVLTLGNDDNQLLIPEMEQGDKEGLWHYIDQKVIKLHGHEFVGMSLVPDYPFGYKYWCAGEFADNPKKNEVQFMTPCIINEDNKFEDIDDYLQYLKDKPSIWESLTKLADSVENMDNSIWLIHAPPSGMGLDVCAHGERVGSLAVAKFIDEYQPLLSIHGHIHESPEYNGKKWKQKCNHTLCVQGGQLGFDLYYSTIEIEDGKIISAKHSEYK
jgi:Icc-related predicted phosphoesterase